MKTLSACLIVKQEEKNIEKILKTTKNFADEIIVVDTGSTDSTKALAAKYTDKIYDFEWCDDFAKARNFSFSKATCDYIIWLDADDFLLEQDVERLNKLKKHLRADVYMLRYVASFDCQYNPTFSYYRERIVKRDKNFVWIDPVHEVILPRGDIRYLDIKIYHGKQNNQKDGRNLQIYQKILQKNEKLSPRQQFYYARELMFAGLYDQAIMQFSKFLMCQNGWVENKIETCLNLAYCYIAKGEFSNALTSLFGSFAFCLPRGEILYQIGSTFLQMDRIDEAIYWLNLARKAKPQEKSGAFVNIDCYNFLPCLQLCVCYYKKGDIKKAKQFNDKAKQIYPQDKSVLQNDNFFNTQK